uniref:Uncharacterized protein n=1 Tax=Rhizophora mucronata TaxID=61149 RepID=A0A2P2NXF8_RHIMU
MKKGTQVTQTLVLQKT